MDEIGTKLVPDDILTRVSCPLSLFSWYPMSSHPVYDKRHGHTRRSLAHAQAVCPSGCRDELYDLRLLPHQSRALSVPYLPVYRANDNERNVAWYAVAF